MYPVIWDANEFVPRTIVFTDVLSYSIAERPCSGRPTILDNIETGVIDGQVSVRMESTAGDRMLSCKSVEVRSTCGPSNTPHQRFGPRRMSLAGQGPRCSAHPLSGKPLG